MYLPAHFSEQRAEVLHALVREHPLATLVTLGAAGIVANHVPLQLQEAASGPVVLRGHVARANPMWSDLTDGVEALAVFQGAQAYISPSWYPTKQEHGKVVPTWNYCAVHAHGVLRIREDLRWLRALVGSLTAEHEAALARPWSVDDAPRQYVESLLQQIVGIEIVVSRLQGKWKLSQNQPARNRAGAAAGLSQRGGADALAMADLVRRHAPGDRAIDS